MHLYWCATCRFGFQDSVSEDVRGNYDPSYFEEYKGGGAYSVQGKQRQHEARLRVAFIKQVVGTPGRVLEIGSAGGFFLAEAKAHGWDVIGLEPADGMAREGAQRSGTVVHSGFIEDINLGTDEFDVVCGWHVLEHIPEPRATLDKLCAALRPSGYAVFEVPNFDSVGSRQAGPEWSYLEPRHHVSQYSPRALQTLFSTTGFEEVSTSTISMFSYEPLRSGIKPRSVYRRLRSAARTRALTIGPDPQKYDLLRISARKPA